MSVRKTLLPLTLLGATLLGGCYYPPYGYGYPAYGGYPGYYAPPVVAPVVVGFGGFGYYGGYYGRRFYR